MEHPLDRLCAQSASFVFVGFVVAKHETFITYLILDSFAIESNILRTHKL